jgi:hypothetical protein
LHLVIYILFKDRCYTGDEVFGLTEHPHLTLYFGFVERLGLSIKRNEVDIAVIKEALSYEFLWHADLIRTIAKRLESLAIERSISRPSCIQNVNRVL